MASWKRVLTTDDVSNTNLGSSDLAPTASGNTFLRKFTLPAATTLSALQFEGYMQYNSVNDTLRPMLRIETDSNSSLVSQNYVYVSSLALGSISSSQALDGTTSKRGYTMPQFNEDHEGNKILISSANWTSVAGSVEFATASTLLGPSSAATGSTITTGTFPSSSNQDTLLFYDNSASEIKHIEVGVLKDFVLQTGRNESLGNSGPYYMKGINGVLLSPTNGHGLVVPYDCYLTRVFGAFEKVSGTSQARRINIYKNNSLFAYTAGFGGGTAVGGYAKTFTSAFTLQSNGSETSQLTFDEGDLVTFGFFTTNATGSASHFQANGYFSTVPVTV